MCCILRYKTALHTQDAANRLSRTQEDNRNTDDDRHTESEFGTGIGLKKA